MFYLDVFKALQDKEVHYLLVGGLAMNLHGVPRMTRDLGQTQAALASIEDMITLKEKSGRKQDLADIEHLRRLRAERE